MVWPAVDWDWSWDWGIDVERLNEDPFQEVELEVEVVDEEDTATVAGACETVVLGDVLIIEEVFTLDVRLFIEAAAVLKTLFSAWDLFTEIAWRGIW